MANWQLLFTFSVLTFRLDLIQSDGKNSGLWVWGTTLYLTILLTVLGKAALISESVAWFSIIPLELTV
jgi:phospholipid-transporting ATPase